MSEATRTTHPEPTPARTNGSVKRFRIGAAQAAAVTAVCLTLFANCAIPVAPTGGPPDREPPKIESIVPTNGAVNVNTKEIRIAFNEYITESSFQQALSITPEPSTRPDIRWKKRTVEIRLKDDLEPNTTYILTIDTRLRDNHGVSLAAPITQAFSTGPEINRGMIRGKVVEPLRGQGLASMQLFAYPLSESGLLDSLPPRPLYRTETDASGEFLFEYLSRRPYFVLAVQDRNGNRRPDNQELIALPPTLAIVADTAGQTIERPWITTRLDTLPPEIRRVESGDVRHVAVRYSEDVQLKAAEVPTWTVSDSLQQRTITVRHVYQLPDDPRSVWLQTARLRPGTYRLTPGAVTDSTGNRSPRDTLTFRVTATTEPEDPRFVSFIPPGQQEGLTIHPATRAGVVFSTPLTADAVRRRVSVEDTAGMALDYSVESLDGVRHYLEVVQAREGHPFLVSVVVDSSAIQDSTVTRLFTYLTARDLGAIVGVVPDVTEDSTVFVDGLVAPDGPIVGSVPVSSGGTFSIGELEVGSYTLRIRRDDNANGKWDGGAIRPFSPAERLFWRADSVRVRARWDTDLDTLRTSLTER